jgi:hypothetical protein
VSGDKLYEFIPTHDLDYMADCYAMNLDLLGDVWCYYYTEFSLVQLRGGSILMTWQPPVIGAHLFAMEPPFVLFGGSYDNREELKLVELLHYGQTRLVGCYFASALDGKPITLNHSEARGSMIHMASGRKLYSINIKRCLQGY